MINELVLVRHATCERMDEMLFGRTVDAPLAEIGLREAEAMARVLQPQQETLIVVSPRRRAQQTAGAIAARCQGELVTSGAIDELDFGHWSGQTFGELARDPDWRRWNEQREAAATPAGERISDVQARVLDLLHRLRQKFPGRPMVMVSHAEVIRATLLHWLQAPIEAYARLAISPASMSRVSLSDWGPRIDGINLRAPL
ncbi:histidine phosphatase family protein [Steroidobacter sp. S1-65]|uniref:Histidine phosphatase family protein n=1 Tax=Steroidobacter gossypii TaxID=2805490 RepID=A0ABS1X479_9GAMM|nr:histidine phosphatase family protein [Steroidobacter gossypii]MBM0108035.1 histidine phosphatase family protein [Steroidobacter gossypii]